MYLLLLTLSALVACQAAVEPLWHGTQPIAQYEAAPLAAPQALFSAFPKPWAVSAVDAQHPSAPQWTVSPQSNASLPVKVFTARRIEKTTAPLPRVRVVAASECTIYGLDSTDGHVVWTHSLVAASDCVNFDLAESDLVVMSDDGSTVDAAVVVADRVQVHSLDAQTGKPKHAAPFFVDASLRPMPRSLSCSLEGRFCALAVDASVLVVDTLNMTLKGDIIPMGASVPAHICPMGVFLIFGFQSASVRRWNPLQNTYAVVFTVSGENNWILTTAMTSVNGGGSHPDGCIVALAWQAYNALQARVDVYSMLSQKHYWQWRSPVSQDNSQDIVSSLAMDMQYLAVSTWGDESAGTPTLHLFDAVHSNATLFEYTSPGSLFAVDTVLDTSADGAPTVWLSAGGKHVHANLMGEGGDAYLFHVNV